MLFRQFLDREPVIAASYLLGCPTKGIGAVVEPPQAKQIRARNLGFDSADGG